MSTPLSTPLEREPRRVRPPYDVPDTTFDHLRSSDPEAWRRALHLDRLAALLEPLVGSDVSDYERTVLEWLAGWETSTVGTVAALLWRAREAAPVTAVRDGEPADGGPRCPVCRTSEVADLGSYLECRGCGHGWVDCTGYPAVSPDGQGDAGPVERCVVCGGTGGQLVLSHDGPDGYLVHPEHLITPASTDSPAGQRPPGFGPGSTDRGTGHHDDGRAEQ